MNTQPQFVRKQEAAERLLMTVRSVNRLIDAGELQGVKLSPGRAAVTADSLETYIAKRTGKPEPSAGPYQSEALCLLIVFDGELPPGGARAIDLHLSRRFGGISVWQLNATELALSWPWSLPYTRDQVYRALAKLDEPAIAIPIAKWEAEAAATGGQKS